MKNLGETIAILLKALEAGKIKDLKISEPGTCMNVEFWSRKGKQVIVNFFTPKGTDPSKAKLSKVIELVNGRTVKTIERVETNRDTLIPIRTTIYGDKGLATRIFRETDETVPGVVKIASDLFYPCIGVPASSPTMKYILNGQVVPGRRPIFSGFYFP